MINIFFRLCGFHCTISSRLVTLKKIGTGFIRNLECHFLRMFLICLFWFSSRSFAFLTLGSIWPSWTFCRSISSPSPKAKPFKFVKPSDIWPKINDKWQNSLFNYNENQSLLIKNNEWHRVTSLVKRLVIINNSCSQNKGFWFDLINFTPLIKKSLPGTLFFM